MLEKSTIPVSWAMSRRAFAVGALEPSVLRVSSVLSSMRSPLAMSGHLATPRLGLELSHTVAVSKWN